MRANVVNQLPDLRLARRENWLTRRRNERRGEYRNLSFQERCKHRKSYYNGGTAWHHPTKTCPRCGCDNLIVLFL